MISFFFSIVPIPGEALRNRFVSATAARALLEVVQTESFSSKKSKATAQKKHATLSLGFGVFRHCGYAATYSMSADVVLTLTSCQ